MTQFLEKTKRTFIKFVSYEQLTDDYWENLKTYPHNMIFISYNKNGVLIELWT